MKMFAYLVLLFLSTTLLNAQENGQILLLGGKGVKQVQVLGLEEKPNGNCSLIPPVPFDPHFSIGLRDNQGRAMVCGGIKNPDPKSCYVLDRSSNTWIQGPKLKHKRVSASATCLNDGKCWVFGGKRTSFTEWYDPVTNEFYEGEQMPVSNAHGLCTALAPSGLVYMAVRSGPGMTKIFTFDPTSETFDEIVDTPEEMRYAACGIHESNNQGTQLFVIVGGGTGLKTGVNTTRTLRGSTLYDLQYPHEVIGATGLPWTLVGGYAGFMVTGGITPQGHLPGEVYSYQVGVGTWARQFSFTLDPPLVFPVAVAVQNEDCP